MEHVFRFRLRFINILGLYHCWIGLESLLRKEVYPYAGKLFFVLLILLDNFLYWKVGNGAEFFIGIDPWVGCKWRHSLPSSMIDKLHSAGFYFLKDIACLGVSILMDQGWLNADILGFVDQEIISWNAYLALLKSSHVRLTIEVDLLL